MANRVRTHGIYLMLSDDELKVLEKKYRLSGCKTLRQFIMRCIIGKDIFVLDMTVFRELSASHGTLCSGTRCHTGATKKAGERYLLSAKKTI